MLLYSKKIIEFIHHLQFQIKEILVGEVGLKVHGNRFYNKNHTASYPIKVVIFDHLKTLGYFEPDFYELGFNKSLMYQEKKLLWNIIRHELAHYLTFIKYGSDVDIHGNEFRATCIELGWGKEIYLSKTTLEPITIEEDEKSQILRKVQKLIALSSSSNPHESELAILKSRELLLKHNLDSKKIQDDETILLKRVLHQKKQNAKMMAISKIVETFFVTTVFHKGNGSIYLEIIGTKINIEIATFVSAFLDTELDRLWDKREKNLNLNGTIAKNSFFLGIAKGYCNKVLALKREIQSDVNNALMVIEKQLIEAKSMIYKNLSKTKSHGNYCNKSGQFGEEVGKNLHIHSPISSKNQTTTLLT